MRFIDRLFPFLDLEVFLANQLSGFWIGGLIAIFIFFLFYMTIRFRTIGRNIRKEKFKNHKKLGKIWNLYQATFSKYGAEMKTDEFSENYFNEESILFACMNFRVVNNIGNTLVGFGILGTFVGLTYGIADSNFETTEAIKISINNLLAGMGTAFVTSIWGMGLSLLFTIIYKFQHSRVNRTIQTLSIHLDSKHKVSREDLNISQQENQKSIINELFNEYLVTETEEGRQLPKNVLRQLLDESVKQTKSLQSFSDDLGTNIEIAMEKLVADNNQQISKLIEEKLVPVLEDLKMIKQESGTQVIEDAVDRLAVSMKEMMEEFKTVILNDTQDQFEGLVSNLTNVSSSLISIPETMTDITLQVAETIEALKETVIENIEISNRQQTEQTQKVTEVFANATSKYESTVEEIQDHMELLLSNQKDNLKQASLLTEKIQLILINNSSVNQEFERMIEKSSTVANLINNVARTLEQNSLTLNETSSKMEDVTKELGKSINDFVTRNNLLLDHQAETLDQTRRVSESYANRFEVIETGLHGIFDQIQTGLKDYQNTTADNLNQYLTEFSTALTKAHQGLENNISGLYDITEELTEQLSKIK
jgi:hypothetical protein